MWNSAVKTPAVCGTVPKAGTRFIPQMEGPLYLTIYTDTDFNQIVGTPEQPRAGRLPVRI